ncbi:acyl-CoA dehydrogenase family protein [Jatrophihabitans fulvus]
MTTAAPDATELDALREAVRDLVAGSGGVGAARRQLDSDPTSGPGYDERAWTLLGRDMGLAGLGLPEDRGGAGGGLAELTVVAEELGRALLPVPFLSSTVLAGQVLARCPDAGEIVAQVASGAVAAFAGVDGDGLWNPSDVPVRASGGRLTGTAPFVLDGADADHLVVAADDGNLYLVAGADAVRRPLATLDPSRGQAEIGLDGTPAQALTIDGSGAAIVTAALDVTLIVLAAEQVGGAQACLDMAVNYAKIRQQFSRPIGSFQTIKHKLADLLLLVEMGRSAVDRALLVDPDDTAALAEAGAVAQVWCSEAFTTCAAENVHVNGGTGFTWEHDAHLFLRRAKADEVLFGDSAYHRERLARLLSW